LVIGLDANDQLRFLHHLAGDEWGYGGVLFKEVEGGGKDAVVLIGVVRTAENGAAGETGADHAGDVDQAGTTGVPGDNDGGDAFHFEGAGYQSDGLMTERSEGGEEGSLGGFFFGNGDDLGHDFADDSGSVGMVAGDGDDGGGEGGKTAIGDHLMKQG
jgi:hypothetical protein